VCCVDVNVPNTQGETALHVASRHRNVEMVQCLVHSGRIDVNAADANGRTAMHICIVGQSNHRIVGDAENILQIAKILAAVDQTWFETRDEDGRTVLLPYSNWHNTWCKNVA
jgi:ankyrin repeat protein